jgi:TldD protein
VSFTRRRFLETGAAAAALAWLPNQSRLGLGVPGLTVPSGRRQPGEPDRHALAARAVDAAKAAGATYADARLSRIREEVFYGPHPVIEQETFAVGVRVLVNGYWGFLSSALWTPDEAVRLAQGAVQQAKANALGKTRDVDLTTVPPVTNGSWHMPVKYDPFDIPIGEKLDVIKAAMDYAQSYIVGTNTNCSMSFRREEKVFASSEGSSWEQTTYVTGAGFSVSYRDEYHLGLKTGGAGADFMSPAGKGWEHISESGLIDAIPHLIDEAEQSRHVVPVDVGRYEAVFNAAAMAALLDATIAPATELDRAMGYEANAEGTSYLNEPLEMLGTFKVGAPLLNVTANRSAVGGAATVKWDDEGVVPDEFPIVKDGILVDYQTTREQASWLKPWYEKHNQPIRSHGCASAESAMYITTQHPPNFTLVPGKADADFDDLVANVEKGVAVLSTQAAVDQQRLNGVGYGTMREIVDGKLGRFIVGGAYLFRSPELWKSLLNLGGPSSQASYGFERGRGQPWQRTTHSVSAVPAHIKQIDLIDAKRKA